MYWRRLPGCYPVAAALWRRCRRRTCTFTSKAPSARRRLLDLAARHGLPEAWAVRVRRPGQLFATYQRVRECLGDAEDFRRIAYELCQDEAAQGVRYAEVTFTPAFHALRLGDWDMPIAAILEGFSSRASPTSACAAA